MSNGIKKPEARKDDASLSSTKGPLRILIMAGGTGGHVFPALAVADELRARGVEVMWLGTRRGLESDVVPRAGIDISYINISGLRGKGWLDLFYGPGKMLYALLQAIQVIRRIKPSAVLGMGGFVTGPGGIGAWVLRKPLLIHEQNAIAGLTNRLLAPFAAKVMEAFPGTFSKALHTGNPVRKSIAALQSGSRGSNADVSARASGPLKLLIVGGSLGAKALNEVVPAALTGVDVPARPQVWHQTGKKLFEETQALYEKADVSARVAPFIEDMDEAYQWADLIVCRAGAMTVAEVAIAGLASVLVPYPFAVDDHQTSNARYLSDAGAAVLMQQTDLSPSSFREMLASLDRKKIADMSFAASEKALPKATELVVEQCLELAHG